ncbi:hemolysin III family protein [bacterium]|nr:hemolysin III family protein [bacterium]
MTEERRRTQGEQLADTATHAIGVGLSIAGLAILVVFAALKGTAWHVVSCSIYGATLVLLYSSSTLYHSFSHTPLEKFFNAVDHSAIYLLIAGTYTPFMMVNLRGPWGWTILSLIWVLAIGGIVFKAFCAGRFRALSVTLYIMMGWLVVVAARPVIAHIPVGGIVWLMIGGVSYTLGTVFYLWRRLPFGHSIWHLFVLGGSISHFFAVLWYVLPQ